MATETETKFALLLKDLIPLANAMAKSEIAIAPEEGDTFVDTFEGMETDFKALDAKTAGRAELLDLVMSDDKLAKNLKRFDDAAAVKNSWAEYGDWAVAILKVAAQVGKAAIL